MSIHIPHPDSHTHGLYDGCSRCYEHSLHPIESLDDENLRQLVRRVVDNVPARSVNERTAMNVIDMVIFGYRRLRQVTTLLD